MITQVELVLTPAELQRLKPADLRQTTCVVFDVLRATSTIAVALSNGAHAITVVSEIEEALALRTRNPDILLAGERGGHRISAAQTGSVDFDLGNSPREFTAERVAHRSLVMSTTNGTRAIRSCTGAASILLGSFLNLRATAEQLSTTTSKRVLVVCAGTGDAFSAEDALGAGALLKLLPETRFRTSSDACEMVKTLHDVLGQELEAALSNTVNGRRLVADPELIGDIACCARRNAVPRPIQVTQDVARFVPVSARSAPAESPSPT
jgi:2-phosphosulfolactate phosphatase